jgi:ABC-2 type transport system permease protein
MFSLTRQEIALAASDFWNGWRSFHIWPMLGWLEIKQRYRRSIIGPFWLTISYGAMIGAMGPLYGRLLQQDISSYFPYLAIGFVVWFFLASLIPDACNAFINAEGFIKQVKLPLTVHVLRVVWKNLIIFAHNVLIVLIILFFYGPELTWHVVLAPLAVLMVAVNGIWFGILFGLLCARFRDIPLVITSLIQVVFFLTPVMWRPEMLGQHLWVADWNPIFHFIEAIRAPILSHDPALKSWVIVIGITIVGYAVSFVMFSRFRSRIAYWV